MKTEDWIANLCSQGCSIKFTKSSVGFCCKISHTNFILLREGPNVSIALQSAMLALMDFRERGKHAE